MRLFRLFARASKTAAPPAPVAEDWITCRRCGAVNPASPVGSCTGRHFDIGGRRCTERWHLLGAAIRFPRMFDPRALEGVNVEAARAAWIGKDGRFRDAVRGMRSTDLVMTADEGTPARRETVPA